MNYNIYLSELKIFFRNKATIAGLLILLVCGIAGLYFGKQFVVQQRAVINKASILQKENTDKNVKYFGEDFGLVLFHNQFSFANVPDNWAAFATGERDINPYLISVTLLGLEGQIYDTDLVNPSTLLLGNMDLSFVIIYLFPLVIIAFCYNVLSDDQESGVWTIVRSASGFPMKIIWRKMMIRLATVFTVLLVLMLCAVIYLDLNVDFRFFTVLMLLTLYIVFWFALSFWVISWGKSSNFNASGLIAFWVLLNILAPAILNVWLTQRYPVPEALENVVKQREGYHEKWDVDKSITMERFYKHYPQFRSITFPAELTFSWYWYFAMQQMGDDEAALSAKKMSEKLNHRQEFTKISTTILPGIQTQLGLNSLAGSDLKNHTEFLERVRAGHEKLRLQFYPSIFRDDKTESIDWTQFTVERYMDRAESSIAWKFLSTGVLTLILLLAGLRGFRRNPATA